MTIWFIATTGNDSTGNGTSGNPYLTVSKAVSVAAANDTLMVAAGTYTFAAQIFNFNFTIIGAGASTTIFDGAGGTPNWYTTATLNITGLTFQNAHAQGATFGVLQAGITAVTNGTLNLISCILNQLFAENDTPYVPLILIGSSTMTLTGCLIRNPSFDPANSPGNNVAGLFSGGFSGTAFLIITNCTFYSNLTVTNTLPIFTNGGLTINVTMTNSIFYNANGTPRLWEAPSAFGALNYSGSNNDILGYTSTPSLANQISVDPLFVDPTNANFNLRPTSPCVDAGTSI